MYKKITVDRTKLGEEYQKYKLIADKEELPVKKILSLREIDILTRYYGIDNQREHTLQELANVHRLTRERVRQIRNVALNKLFFITTSKWT